jgi:hypothetical protein
MCCTLHTSHSSTTLTTEYYTQNVFLLVNKGKFGSASLNHIIGVIWAVSFFVVRILPIPWVFSGYYETVFGACGGVKAFDRIVAALTIPVPIMLNVYWFSLIIRKVLQIFGCTKNRKSSGTVEIEADKFHKGDGNSRTTV